MLFYLSLKVMKTVLPSGMNIITSWTMFLLNLGPLWAHISKFLVFFVWFPLIRHKCFLLLCLNCLFHTWQGIYNENPSLVFHPGYAYNPQMPYGPFSPVTTPVPSVRGDGPLYSPQQFPFSAPYYQQPGPPNVPYITSPLPVSHPELPVAGIDPQGVHSCSSFLFHGSVFKVNVWIFSKLISNSDLGFDVFGSGGPWSEWSKFSEGPRSLTPGPSPVASPQPVPSLRSFNNNGAPSGMGMVCNIV